MEAKQPNSVKNAMLMGVKDMLSTLFKNDAKKVMNSLSRINTQKDVLVKNSDSSMKLTSSQLRPESSISNSIIFHFDFFFGSD
jgi:hypothetical protein